MANLKSLCLLLLCSFTFQSQAFAVDINEVEKQLNSSGAEGWIHGAVEKQGLYVFTIRNPKDFFDYAELSLVASNAEIEQKLAAVQRHDKVRIQGKFMKNPSPQKHVLVSAIEVLKKYESPYPTSGHEYEAKIPDDLKNSNSATFLVHAIAGEGKILVVEYKDAIIPVFVKKPELAKDLYRNDLIKLAYKIQEDPGAPMHLNLDASADRPIEVVESIKAINGKPASVEGALILFPKSPEISLNVFAVEQPLQNGLNRQYTIVNFEDNTVFTEMLKTMQAAWDRHPKDIKNGRNKLVSTKVRVKVTGTFNEVSPSQANAQILVDSLDQLQIIEAQ